MEVDVKRRRRFKGRSKNGCVRCRGKHIKCDEAKPICGSCLVSQQSCDWPSSRFSRLNQRATSNDLVRLLYNPSLLGDGNLEESVFHRFATVFAPKFGKIYDETFWINSVLPAARMHDSVFSATLAMATLYNLSVDQLSARSMGIVVKRYQDATEWYSRSVNTMIRGTATDQSANDISVILLTTALYYYIEMRQGHYANTHNLIRVAFHMLYSARSKLWDSANSNIFAIVLHLLQSSTTLMVDALCVSVRQRRTVIALGLKLAADLGVSEPTLLRLELYSLLYDIQDTNRELENTMAESSCVVLLKKQCISIVEANNDTESNEVGNIPAKDESGLDKRLRDWYLRLIRYETTIPSRSVERGYLHRMKILFVQFDTQLQIHRDDRRHIRQAAEPHLSRLLSMIEAEALATGKDDEESPTWLAESTIIPVSIFISWYWRQEFVLARMVKATESFLLRYDNILLRKTLIYLRQHIQSDPTQATTLERKLFGGKPTVFQRWHCYILSCELA